MGFISSIIGLRTLSFNKTANLTFINYENERTAQFSPAPAGLRFTNRLIDAVLILYILWINASSLIAYFNFNISPRFYFLLEIPFLLFYYIILEGIFNTSAGKCATNTTIVNMQGERPSFAQILGRTFCRLIPFEAFSFLGEGARGWHDSLTNTYVTDSINKEDFEMNEFTLDAELNNNTNANYYSAG
ncbi:MAG: RDD family protein [Ferruginibacter sp.]